MSVEIEAKMKVVDHASVREKLQQLGAMRKKSELETNMFFDRNDRSLLAEDKGLRLRAARNVESGKTTAKITFKGPRQPGELKNREEREVGVESPESASALFEALGYVKMISFEKRRETWDLGNCEIVLDEVPFLGAFVEIEGPDEKTVLGLRERLGLSDRPMIKASYVAMITSYLQERGIANREVKFPALQ